MFLVPRPQLQRRSRNRPAVSLTTRTCPSGIRRPCSRWRPHGHPKLVHDSGRGRLLYGDIPQPPKSLVRGAARASAKATGPAPLPRGVNHGCAPVAEFCCGPPCGLPRDGGPCGHPVVLVGSSGSAAMPRLYLRWPVGVHDGGVSRRPCPPAGVRGLPS